MKPCPTCNPVIKCKSVEKRLAIQQESEYDRGFRHGLANCEENARANIAMIEQLRDENQRIDARLQDLELFIHKLYKYNHNEGIGF